MYLCVSSELGVALRHLRGFCQYIKILGVGMFCVMNVTSLLWYQCLYQYAYVSDETSTEERESHENIYCLFNLYFIE